MSRQRQTRPVTHVEAGFRPDEPGGIDAHQADFAFAGDVGKFLAPQAVFGEFAFPGGDEHVFDAGFGAVIEKRFNAAA